MKVPTQNQTFFIVPAQDLTEPFAITYNIYSESERKFLFEVGVNENFTEESYFYKLEIDVQLKEAESYILEIFNPENDLIYRGSFFATDQPEDYSINEGKYVQHESNNEYIILDNE